MYERSRCNSYLQGQVLVYHAVMTNKNTGTVIRLFLIDGSAQGLRTAEVMNWTGQVMVGSRSNLGELGSREESKKTGVYMLVGKDLQDLTTNIVYVGESDNVYDRLKSHAKDEKKDFWESTIIVTSKDANLTKTDVRYLESRLIQITKQANRANLSNGTSPSSPPISEPDIAVMEDFLERTVMVVSVMGFDFLRTVQVETAQTDQASDQSPVFVLTSRGVHAKAIENDGEFVVLEGSTARRDTTRTLKNNIPLRERMISEGVFVSSEDERFYRLTANTAFASPSAAGNVFSAQSINGRTAWKLEESGKSYADWQEESLN
jgi:hypothetical protein